MPIYNKSGAVRELHQKIVAVMNSLRGSCEIIFIGDGSTDKTFEILSQLQPIKIIRFRKNFGQTAALDAGIKAAKSNLEKLYIDKLSPIVS